MAEQGPPPSGVFISYRREDNPYPPAWLYASLRDRFGRGQAVGRFLSII